MSKAPSMALNQTSRKNKQYCWSLVIVHRGVCGYACVCLYRRGQLVYGMCVISLGLPKPISQTAWFKQQIYFTTILQARSQRSRRWQGQSYSEASLLGLWMSNFSLGLHMDFPLWVCVLISSYNISHISLVPNHITSFCINYIFKGSTPKTATFLGSGSQYFNI